MTYIYFIKRHKSDTLLPFFKKKKYVHTELVEIFHSVAKFFHSVSLNPSNALMQILKQGKKKKSVKKWWVRDHSIWMQSICSVFIVNLVFVGTENFLNVKSLEIEASNLKASKKSIGIIDKLVIFLIFRKSYKIFYHYFINNFSWFYFIMYVELPW